MKRITALEDEMAFNSVKMLEGSRLNIDRPKARVSRRVGF
jgi:hypothetical protein